MDDEQQKSITEEIRDNVKLILEILNGNGAIGMCAKVTILWRTSLFVLGVVILVAIRAFFT